MKKNFTKLGYMAFGCVLTLIGYHFGNIDNNSVNAQENSPIVDEVRCRRLVIVGADNTPRITLGTDFLHRGYIQIYNEDGELRIDLDVDWYDRGIITVLGKESGGIAAQLGVDDNGGYMALWNKLINKAVLQAAVNHKGGAFLLTRDKAGYDTDTAGVQEYIMFNQKIRN